MSRSNSSKQYKDPEEINAAHVSKNETLILDLQDKGNITYTLPNPDKPLGNDNDLLILNDADSRNMASVNGYLIRPGTGLKFRWAGSWYLMGAPPMTRRQSREIEDLTHHDIKHKKMKTRVMRNEAQLLSMEAAACGRVQLGFDGDLVSIVEVSAAALNADAAYAKNQAALIGMYDTIGAEGKQHWMRDMTVLMSVAENIVDATVPNPTVQSATVNLKGGVASTGVYFGTNTGTYASDSAQAVGQFTAVGGDDLLNTDTFTVTGNTGHSVTWQFNDGTGTVTAGNYYLAYEAGVSATDMATRMASAIRSVGNLNVGAVSTAAVVDLTQGTVGNFAAAAATESVTDAGFLVTDFANGKADNIVVTLAVESSAAAGDNKLPNSNFTLTAATRTYVVK